MNYSRCSPLRYPGGKNKIYKYIKNLIERNDLKGCTYIEPFAGGCGLSMPLLMGGTVSKLILNDIDRSIYAFWYSVLNHTNELCNLIIETPVTIDQWYIQKEVQHNKNNENLLNLGFSTFFLNRTNVSGIIKGGVMGGKNQIGNYKIDCRFNKENLIQRIKTISSYKSSIELHSMDAIDLISICDENSLMLLDPPYYKKGKSLYSEFFSHSDHKKLSEKIKTRSNFNWILTYDDCKEIRDMYDLENIIDYKLRYSANTKYMGSEIMIFSDNLDIVGF